LVNSTGAAHLYEYKDVNPELAEALAKSFFEVTKAADSARIGRIVADAAIGDEAATRTGLAAFAREVYQTYCTTGSLDTLSDPLDLRNLDEIKLFFADLADFINTNNIPCDPNIPASFNALATLESSSSSGGGGCN